MGTQIWNDSKTLMLELLPLDCQKLYLSDKAFAGDTHTRGITPFLCSIQLVVCQDNWIFNPYKHLRAEFGLLNSSLFDRQKLCNAPHGRALVSSYFYISSSLINEKFK